jgi:hypothetical protein
MRRIRPHATHSDGAGQRSSSSEQHLHDQDRGTAQPGIRYTKGKRLFALLGAKQLASMDEAPDAEAKQDALAYTILFSAARDHFIVTNNTAMRSLLTEFRNHGLVLSAAQDGPGSGEVLWIRCGRSGSRKFYHL